MKKKLNKPNFDVTHELEELLIEENPLKANPRKKKAAEKSDQQQESDKDNDEKKKSSE